jgi:pilus assembly protein CpaF
MNDQYIIAPNVGPLEPLLADPQITEIFVDGPGRISIVRSGKLVDLDARFDDEQQLVEVIRAIAAPLGHRFDESHPLLEARLFDGSRISAVCPPIALDGPALVISKAKKNTLSVDDLVGFGSWNEQIVTFLRGCVAGRMNILLAGNSASGKTTYMNLLCEMIPGDERIIAVQETNELVLKQRRVVRFETRPPNLEGRGAITLRDLVLQALRMYPERLIIGELRGAEVWPLIQAINNGHDGSMATIHASSPRDALARLEIMATSSDPSIPLINLREQVASALNLIVQVTRFADGRRRMTQIAEVQRIEREVIVLQDLFTFVEGPRDAEQRDNGRFTATGQLPAFLTLLRQRGVELSLDLFKPA